MDTRFSLALSTFDRTKLWMKHLLTLTRKYPNDTTTPISNSFFVGNSQSLRVFLNKRKHNKERVKRVCEKEDHILFSKENTQSVVYNIFSFISHLYSN